MLRFEQLEPLLGRRSVVDVACPACSPHRKPAHRKLKVLRVWAVDAGMVSYYCAHCEEAGYARSDDDDRGWASDPKRIAELKRRQALRATHEAEQLKLRIARARELWNEAGPVAGSWAEVYLASRGLQLGNANGLRCHPRCPFPDRQTAPALLVGFTAFSSLLGDPFADAEPIAIHRIRGRGRGNKFMLGPVAGAAMMLDPPHEIVASLSVCEGVETGLAVRRWAGEPVWALGSAGAMEKFPLLKRVRRLTVWADSDEVGREAARLLGQRYADAGREVIVRWPEEGSDYAG